MPDEVETLESPCFYFVASRFHSFYQGASRFHSPVSESHVSRGSEALRESGALKYEHTIDGTVAEQQMGLDC
jgi:hypothetical protein